MDPEQPDDPEGQLPKQEMHERYLLRQRLGEGGVGVVHEVVDQNLDTAIALKTLHTARVADPVARERLIEEARVTAKLDHPGVVPVHELGVDRSGRVLAAGALYFTMKKVEGCTLADRLGARRFPPSHQDLYDDLRVVLRVCDAVAFAHSRGVIHRDIKPANIMVGQYGQVHLMDWGIAKVVGRPGLEFAGTLAYMAPEQARADWDAIDERTDVFLLGAVLYEILTGRPPHQVPTGNEQGLRFQALMCQVPDARVVAGWRVPHSLADIAMKALAKQPADRHASVLELQAELDEFLRSGWQFPRLSFPRGACIVREHDPGHAAYVIVHGRCRAYKTVEGEPLELRVMQAGDVFGETAVFAQQPRTATVEALDDVVVLEITKEFFLDEEGVGYWLGRFVRALAERFCERDARAAELERRLSEVTSGPSGRR